MKRNLHSEGRTKRASKDGYAPDLCLLILEGEGQIGESGFLDISGGIFAGVVAADSGAGIIWGHGFGRHRA